MPAIYLMGTPIGDRIVSLRISRGWSQGQLAYQAKVEQTWLSNVEVGRTKKPDAEYLVRVARALGTSVEYLVEGREEAGRDPATQAIYRRLLRYPPDLVARFERAMGALFSEQEPPDHDAQDEGNQKPQ